MADEERQVLGNRYLMGERLGSGGMATVFLAEDRVLERQVAIKWLRTGPENADSAARRFRREARITASLNHPNTVQLYDAVVEGPDLFLVMEYVPGTTLAQRMREADLAATEVLKILGDIGNALDNAHQRGVVHRDVKPANILLDSRTGKAKLADLGIASTIHATHMTTSGSTLGTPAYMAPEVLDGRTATAAADIYSLGAVAFEALSGHPLREGDSAIAIAVQAVMKAPKHLQEVQPSAPAAAAEVVDRALARDPGKRPTSCRDFTDTLRAAYRQDTRLDGARAGVFTGAGADYPAAGPTDVLRDYPASGPAGDAAGGPGVVPAGYPAGGPADVPAGYAAGAPGDVRSDSPPDAPADADVPADVPAGLPPDAPAGVPADVPAGVPADVAAAGPPESGPPTRAWPTGRRWRRPAAIIGACAVALVALVLVLILVPGGSHRSTPPAATTSRRPAAPKTTGKASAPSTAPRSPVRTTIPAGGPPQSATGPAINAVAAVKQFYLRAARHDYPDAWALAAPSYRQQLGGYDSFRATFANVLAISFQEVQTVSSSGGSATVAVRTVSRQTNQTQYCAGTVSTQRVAPRSWLVSQISIQC